MVTAINYGWTGILGFIVILLVYKFHRPLEVALWVYFMRRSGKVGQRTINQTWRKAMDVKDSRRSDFMLALTDSLKGNLKNPDQDIDGPEEVATRANRETTSLRTPTRPRTSTKRAGTAKKSTAPAAIQDEPPIATASLESLKVGRHAKPDLLTSSSDDHLRTTTSGRHSAAREGAASGSAVGSNPSHAPQTRHSTM